jgi:hypothetical protein
MKRGSVDADVTVINVDAIANTAFVGINRVWLFLGLGVNAANNAERSDLEIPDASYLRLLPDDLPETTLAEAKAEFGTWIVSNGLREAIDTFDVFLGQVEAAALTIESWKVASGHEVDMAPYNERATKFSRFGTAKRLESLASDFAIAADYGGDIVSVRRARNCLTHRLGLVGPEDIGRHGFLTVRWHAIELYGVNQDGSEFVPSLDALPIKFPESSPVNMRHAPRERRFGLGERLILSPSELKQICYTFRLAVEQVRSAFVTYAESMGVQPARLDSESASDGARK